jgi:hypothetical protein
LLLACLQLEVLACEVDLSSPEATVLGYCYSDVATVQQYFAHTIEPKVMGGKSWLECKVVSVIPTDKVGSRFGKIPGFGEVVVQPGDMEVVLEIKLDIPESGNPKTKYHYFVRKIDGAWKIYMHSHIDDEIIPAYD